MKKCTFWWCITLQLFMHGIKHVIGKHLNTSWDKQVYRKVKSWSCMNLFYKDTWQYLKLWFKFEFTGYVIVVQIICSLSLITYLCYREKIHTSDTTLCCNFHLRYFMYMYTTLNENERSWKTKDKSLTSS